MSSYFSFKRFWINEEFSTPMNGNIMTSISSTSTSMLSGAPSGSVPKKNLFYRQIFGGWEMWEKIICPWKESVAGKWTIQGV